MQEEKNNQNPLTRLQTCSFRTGSICNDNYFIEPTQCGNFALDVTYLLWIFLWWHLTAYRWSVGMEKRNTFGAVLHFLWCILALPCGNICDA